MAENFDHIAAAHARNAAMAGPAAHVEGVLAGNKNPIVGEPQGPSMSSRNYNRQKAAMNTIHDRIAMQDKGYTEGQATRRRLAPKKK